MHRLALLLLACCLPFAAAAAAASCPPAGESLASLEAMKAAGWSLPEARRAPMATALLDCLGDPDPRLRDELAFDGLQSLMRRKMLDTATVEGIRARLVADLTQPDPSGFRRPFAVLTLAEVARVDRITPFLGNTQRADLVATAARFLRDLRDYRGFEEGAGWRHGVAHGSDLVVQLAVNKAITAGQGEALLDAVLSQTMPVGHAYVFGEPGRMTAAVFYLASRGWWDAAFWRGKLQARVGAMGKPDTLQGLRDRHNLESFTNALAVNVLQAGSPAMKEALLPAVLDTLKAFD